MKNLLLKNPSFRYLEQSFREWLDVLGYAPVSVYNMPLQIRELLHYPESKKIASIKELDIKHVKAHYNKLKERSNVRRGGRLSNDHLNKHIQALRKFTDYLRQVGRLFVSIEGGSDLTNYMTRLMVRLRKQNKLVVNAKQILASVIVKWLKQYNLRQVHCLTGQRYISSIEAYRINEMEGLTEEVNKFHPLG